MSDTPLSKDEEDFALRRMPVFDMRAEVAKVNKMVADGRIKLHPRSTPLEHQPKDWIWEKDVNLGWLGLGCIQVYGTIDGDTIDDLRIMLGKNDITNEVPDKVISELIAEIFEER